MRHRKSKMQRYLMGADSPSDYAKKRLGFRAAPQTRAGLRPAGVSVGGMEGELRGLPAGELRAALGRVRELAERYGRKAAAGRTTGKMESGTGSGSSLGVS